MPGLSLDVQLQDPWGSKMMTFHTHSWMLGPSWSQGAYFRPSRQSCLDCFCSTFFLSLCRPFFSSIMGPLLGGFLWEFSGLRATIFGTRAESENASTHNTCQQNLMFSGCEKSGFWDLGAEVFQFFSGHRLEERFGHHFASILGPFWGPCSAQVLIACPLAPRHRRPWHPKRERKPNAWHIGVQSTFQGSNCRIAARFLTLFRP